MQVYVPSNFDPNDIPPELVKYIDDIKYFLHLIYQQRVLNRRHKEGFIPLKAEYLRNIISRRYFGKIKSFLLTSGMIETDGQWIRGKKAYGYRLGKKYKGFPCKKTNISSKLLTKKVYKAKIDFENEITLETHVHLFNKLKEIKIDYENAILSLDCEDYAMNQISIEMMNNQDWFFKPDKYGRVHTNITNLKGSLRRFLTHENEKLCEIDIINSQPFFFGIILSMYVKNNKVLNSYSLPSLPLRWHISPNLDVQLYTDLVQSGEFYNYLSNQFNVPISNRRLFKTKLFSEIFFCRNNKKSSRLEKFKQLFPTVLDVIQELKKNDYTILSKYLQKVESSFVINGFVRDCMNARPDMFITTIHDSVLVKERDLEWAKERFIKQFTHTGLTPTLSEKIYS